MNLASKLLDAFSVRDAEALNTLLQNAMRGGSYTCYVHPLGFYFVRLVVQGKMSLRLHYWPASYREEGSAITPYHDHVWKLQSFILSGAIENVMLDIVEDELGAYQLAQINQIDGVDEVVPSGRTVSVNEKSRQRLMAGEYYEIEAREFHYTDIPRDQAAITVVRSDIVVDGGPRTLVPSGFQGRHAPSRDPVQAPEQIQNEIAAILERGLIRK